MIRNFLKEVILIIIGKPAENIADLLDTKKYINEFVIAKNLDITINQARNFLYKLSDYGVVSSIRKKDKKKGWFTYFWRIEPLKALEFLKANLEKRAEQTINQIKSREEKIFYICNVCNIEHTEENALLYDFTCNECGNIFSIKDNSKTIKEFKKNLEKLQKTLKEIAEGIRLEKEKIQKEVEKESRKIEKEKEVKRILHRQQAKKLRKQKLKNGYIKKKIIKKLIKKKK